jgi:hypothetical protein
MAPEPWHREGIRERAGGGEAEAVVEGGITERGAAELIRIAHGRGRVQIPTA